MRKTICISALLLIASLSLASESHGEGLDSLAELKKCARTEGRDARIACYELLGERALSEDVEGSVAAPAAATASTAERLPDDLGGLDFAKQAGAADLAKRGHVESCRKASDSKWFYIFESGQVWKQVDNRRVRHRDCDFYVTITRDGLGYKMQIDGKESKIRVNRRK